MSSGELGVLGHGYECPGGTGIEAGGEGFGEKERCGRRLSNGSLGLIETEQRMSSQECPVLRWTGQWQTQDSMAPPPSHTNCAGPLPAFSSRLWVL